MRLTGLWGHADFRRLWAGQTISVFGSMITGTALPFTAILLLDAGAFEVALLSACRIVPGLLVGLPAGVWVDRLYRRPVMIAADAGRAALVASIPVAYAFDGLHLEQLYLVALTGGVLTMFFDVAYQAYLPSIVTRDELLEGNSKLTASAAAAEFSGFGVSGWLVQIFSGPIAMGIDAVTFVVSALFIGSIRAPEPPPAPAATRSTVAAEAVEGLRTVARAPLLRSIAFAMALYAVSFGIIGSVISLFALRELGFAPGVLGIIFGIGGLSSLTGAVLAPRAARTLGVGPSMITGLALMAMFSFLLPAARGETMLAAVLLLLPQIFGDGSFTMYQVNEISLRQSVVPERLLGRVNSCFHIVEHGSLLIGTLAGGLVGEVFGLRVALVAGACVLLSAALWLAISPVRALRTAPEPPPLEPSLLSAVEP